VPVNAFSNWIWRIFWRQFWKFLGRSQRISCLLTWHESIATWGNLYPFCIASAFVKLCWQTMHNFMYHIHLWWTINCTQYFLLLISGQIHFLPAHTLFATLKNSQFLHRNTIVDVIYYSVARNVSRFPRSLHLKLPQAAPPFPALFSLGACAVHATVSSGLYTWCCSNCYLSCTLENFLKMYLLILGEFHSSCENNFHWILEDRNGEELFFEKKFNMFLQAVSLSYQFCGNENW
jgi:hypothetical protein